MGPSHRLQRGFALAAVITNGAIAVTGAVVRVTGSGLGCPTWPECHPGSLVPVIREENSTFHQLIEFGNRTLTGVVLIASLGTFLLIWRARPRRRSLVWLAAALPALVLFQAVWGGMTVLFGLVWWTVAPHMLISLGLLSVAVWVHQRLGEGDAPVAPDGAATAQPAGLGHLRGAAAAVCRRNPRHRGRAARGRRHHAPAGLSVRGLAQVHADLMFTYLGLLVAFAVALIAVRAPLLLRRRMWILVAVTLAQGVLGVVQYQLGVPEALVVLHVTGAVLLVTAAVRMLFATRTRAVAPTA